MKIGNFRFGWVDAALICIFVLLGFLALKGYFRSIPELLFGKIPNEQEIQQTAKVAATIEFNRECDQIVGDFQRFCDSIDSQLKALDKILGEQRQQAVEINTLLEKEIAIYKKMQEDLEKHRLIEPNKSP